VRVLIGCERSGVVRRAFRALGHDAWSCDLEPSDDDSPHHLQCDVRTVLRNGWDLAIFHPECTYLTNAGVRHLHSVPSSRGRLPTVHGPARWLALFEAAAFFRTLRDAPIDSIAIENPIPHRYARDLVGPYTQLIQPWMFGHGETKATCLWLKGLPKLVPTEVVGGRVPRIHHMAPGADRRRKRSETMSGIGAAMAAQWGAHMLKAAA
jgi:hypothetical protein